MVKLITGGTGQIGAELARILVDRGEDVVLFDIEVNRHRIHDIEYRVKVVPGDVGDFPQVLAAVKDNHVTEIYHLGAVLTFASELNPGASFRTNVIGTFNMLEFARKCKNLKAFVYFSTVEVFGPAPKGVEYKEWDRYNCTNPYSATKAGAEELCLSYMNTYGIKGFITHCMNIFGERQHPEKFIPLCIRKINSGEKIIIHGTPDKKRSGSRFYIHARNVANAIHFLLDKFEQREKYNIVGEKELTNLKLAKLIAKAMNKKLEYEIVDFHSSRPGHDLRYALDGQKMKELGWKVPITIEKTLETTVKWTLENDRWLYIHK